MLSAADNGVSVQELAATANEWQQLGEALSTTPATAQGSADPPAMRSQRAALPFCRHLHPRPNAGPPSRSLPLTAPPPLRAALPQMAPPPLPVCSQLQLQTPRLRRSLPPLLKPSFPPLRLQLMQTRQVTRPPLAACWGWTLPMLRCLSWSLL